MRPADILQSYALMMLIGLFLGLLTGGLPVATKEVSMASLALLMAFSLSTVKLGDARGPEHVRHAAWALLANYGALSALILLLGLAFSKDLWPGWVLMAAAPSAVSIVPFTRVLGGPTTKALFSTAVNYILALLLMPFMTLALLGSAVQVTELLLALILLIAVPMAASRLISKMGIHKPTNTAVINFLFALLIFTVAGANRRAFAGDIGVVLAICAAGAVRTFGIGLGTERVLRWMRVPKADRGSYVLFASYKNLGLTATLAIALFEPVAAVPATICIVLEVVWIIFLVRYYREVPE